MIMMIISILLAVFYTGAAIWTKGRLPDSISAMVYDFPKAGKWTWTLWIWAVAELRCPTLFDTIPEDLGVVAHCFATSMMFTSAMPLVKGDRNKAHNVLGISAGIFSQIIVAIISADWLFAWSIFLFLMGSAYIQPNGWLGRAVKGKGVFVAEVICWLSLMGCLIFK